MRVSASSCIMRYTVLRQAFSTDAFSLRKACAKGVSLLGASCIRLSSALQMLLRTCKQRAWLELFTPSQHTLTVYKQVYKPRAPAAEKFCQCVRACKRGLLGGGEITSLICWSLRLAALSACSVCLSKPFLVNTACMSRHASSVSTLLCYNGGPPQCLA